MADWKPGAFAVRIANNGKQPRDYQVAGWISDPWALDFRAFSDGDEDYLPGWCLTHLPTGFVAGGILAPIHQAQLIAEEVAASGDWRFYDASKAKTMGAKVRAVRDRHSDRFVLRSASLSPFSFVTEAAS